MPCRGRFEDEISLNVKGEIQGQKQADLTFLDIAAGASLISSGPES
jgi:hypothetical protein